MSFVDVLIVGGGPSGLSAALTLVRQNHSVVLFDTNQSRAHPSPFIHGYSGWEHKSPAEYLTHARSELQPFKCFTAVDAEVTNLAAVDGGFKATDKNGKTYQSKKVILAHGVASIYPDIPGYAECWGKGIFHNLFAQAYQPDPSSVRCGILAVDWIARPQYTYHLAHLAYQLAHNVTIYTNGNEELVKQIGPTIKGKPWTPDTRKIAKLALKSPEDTAVEITFEDGSTVTEAFLGHSPIMRLNGPFAEQLGLKVSQMGSEYETSGPVQVTSVPGVYATGDTMNVFKMLSNAVASGAQVAASVAVTLQEEKWDLPSVYG